MRTFEWLDFLHLLTVKVNSCVCACVCVCVCVCVYVYVCVYSDAVAKYSSFYSDQLHVALAVYQS